jgi:hypothetical protein
MSAPPPYSESLPLESPSASLFKSVCDYIIDGFVKCCVCFGIFFGP